MTGMTKDYVIMGEAEGSNAGLYTDEQKGMQRKSKRAQASTCMTTRQDSGAAVDDT